MEFEIDGKKVTAEQGDMIIEAADDAGVHIPRFCYHKKLSIAANCRMCLVEIEKSGKPLPACATPVTDGMRVFTKSAKALDAQKIIMEFLLINHPLDCPICDQGGECELQDVSMGYGGDISKFTEGKRVVADEDLGSLVATDMTRCIQCTRCVRFGEEVSGLRELAAVGRGEHTEISTYVGKSLKSELSGNIIDLCPVGALTSKPFRFTARAWELQQHESIAPHDCAGSNIFLHSRRNEIMRVVPRENEKINECWLSDRDRFSYQGLNSSDRILKPLVKRDGEWKEVEWEVALDYVVSATNTLIKQYGETQIGAMASPSSTTEEFYLFQKLMRGLETDNIDHRIRQIDTTDELAFPPYPDLGISLEAIEKQDAILLIGANVYREQPIIAHHLRKAALADSTIMSIAQLKCHFYFDIAEEFLLNPDNFVLELAGIAKVLLDKNGASAPSEAINLLNSIPATSAKATAMAQHLLDARSPYLLLGALADHHPQASILRALAQLIAKMCKAKIGFLSDGANSAGAYLSGFLPSRGVAGSNINEVGLSASGMINLGLKGYFLLNLDPEIDCANPGAMTKSLAEADFVVSISPYRNAVIEKYANVILPNVPFSETTGSFINVEGVWQGFRAAVTPKGEARPAWKIFRVLGNLFNLKDFDYASVKEVQDEIKELLNAMPERNPAWFAPDSLDVVNNSLTRITAWTLYGSDQIVRRAGALQASASSDPRAIQVNAKLAKQFNIIEGQDVTVVQNGGQAKMPVIINNAIPDNAVLVMASEQTSLLGESFGAIELIS